MDTQTTVLVIIGSLLAVMYVATVAMEQKARELELKNDQ